MNFPSESAFNEAAARTFSLLMDALEPSDQAGILEVESTPGMVTVSLANGRQIILSKHSPTRQIWLSSPVSGGLHFSSADGKCWKLSDGRGLEEVLRQDVLALGGPGLAFANLA